MPAREAGSQYARLSAALLSAAVALAACGPVSSEPETAVSRDRAVDESADALSGMLENRAYGDGTYTDYNYPPTSAPAPVRPVAAQAVPETHEPAAASAGTGAAAPAEPAPQETVEQDGPDGASELCEPEGRADALLSILTPIAAVDDVMAAYDESPDETSLGAAVDALAHAAEALSYWGVRVEEALEPEACEGATAEDLMEIAELAAVIDQAAVAVRMLLVSLDT